jgi:hypothetical protein
VVGCHAIVGCILCVDCCLRIPAVDRLCRSDACKCPSWCCCLAKPPTELERGLSANRPALVVSGAGEARLNGCYELVPRKRMNGRPCYTNTTEGSKGKISYNSSTGKWNIALNYGGSYYHAESPGGDAESPPLEGWQVNAGKAPAPTVALQLTALLGDTELPATEPGFAMEGADMSRQ